MAQLPVPGHGGKRQLSRTDPSAATGGTPYRLPHPIPPAVREVLSRLTDAGHDAVLVGGSVRDLLRGERPTDWDVATSAAPEMVAALFPGSTWLNRFGTVTVNPAGAGPIEVTSYRSEAGYRDRRRPDEVRFGVALERDLERRDFTINAVAWRPAELAAGDGDLIDPHGGRDDLSHGILRAVGDPAARFGEDALRVLRAVRFATALGLQLEPVTAEAMRTAAPTVAGVSGERLRDELLRILGHPVALPSAALQLMLDTGVLPAVLPELVALRGVPQGKPLAGDAFDHSLRTMDALPATDPLLRLAGLLHDLGKAATLAGGHFIGHEEVGATMAAGVLERLRLSQADAARITHLVRQHMFAYDSDWTDAAVRRFVRRVGAAALEDLFALRAADNRASGVAEPARGGVDELRRRIEEVAAAVPLATHQLAVDGHDLQAALGLPPSPEIGRLLGELLEATIEDPSLNERETLIGLARRMARPVD